MFAILIQVAPWMLAAALPVLVFALVPKAVPADQLAEQVVPADPGRAARAQKYLIPKPLLTRLERNLALAGLTGTWAVQRIVLIKNVLGAVGAVLAAGILLSQPGSIRLVIALVVLVGAYLAPDLVVWGRAQERQELIQDKLADTLDQITISIEAGLGLETAVSRAGKAGTGPLADELVRTVQDMRVGLSRREAYTALADRTTVVDLKRFARAIMQADAYGVPVGNVVRMQAKELRIKRRQRAEEKAMRIPVKVLFPLMLCILPVLFIVVLGPAVINLVGVFGAVGQ